MSSWTYGTKELNKIAGSGDNAMLNLSGLAEGMGIESSKYVTMPRADNDNQFRPALYFRGKDNNLHNFYNQDMGNRSLMQISNYNASIFFGLLFNSQGFTEANAPQTQFVIGAERSGYAHDALYLDSICFPDFDYKNDSINFVCQYGYIRPHSTSSSHKSVISITHKDNILNDNLEKPWIVMIDSYEDSNKFFNDLDSFREIVILSNNKMYKDSSQTPLKYQPMNDITGFSDYAYSRQMIFSDYLGFNTEDHKLYASPVLKNAVLYDKRVKDGAMVYNNPYDGKEYLVVMRGCPSMAPLVVQGY